MLVPIGRALLPSGVALKEWVEEHSGKDLDLPSGCDNSRSIVGFEYVFHAEDLVCFPCQKTWTAYQSTIAAWCISDGFIGSLMPHRGSFHSEDFCLVNIKERHNHWSAYLWTVSLSERASYP